MTRTRAAAIAVATIALGCRRPAEAVNTRAEEAYRLNNRGVALLEQLKFDDAVTAFGDAVAVDSSLGLVHQNLAVARYYAQRLGPARQEAAEAQRLMPQAPQPPYLLALIAIADNSLEDAEADLRRVESLDPTDTGTLIALGQLYVQRRRYGEAIGVLRKAVAEEPFSVTAAYNLGLALVRSGSADEGQALVNRSQVLRAAPYSTTFGSGYLEQGRYAEAMVPTGAEPQLVQTAPEAVTFAPARIATIAAPDRSRLAPLAFVDLDGDGRADLWAATARGDRLFHNDGGNRWTDVSAASGLSQDAASVGAVAGDYDNDGLPDLLVLEDNGVRLYHNDRNRRFTDVTAAVRLPAFRYRPTTAAFVDLDHDGDLDVVIGGQNAPILVARNNGNASFTDITMAAGFAGLGARTATALVPTDFDNGRDVDLLVAYRDGSVDLMKNLRDGTFRDVARDAGLDRLGRGPITAVAAGDVNKDGYPDLFFSRDSSSTFALSDGHGGFTTTPGPPGAANASTAQFVDYDADGLLDIVTASAGGPRVFRNTGAQWMDVTPQVGLVSAGQPFAGLAAADVDADGRSDLAAIAADGVIAWRNGGAGRNASVRVVLKPRVSNRTAAGAKVELRAGSLQARAETMATTPPVAPVDTVFGLGARAGADAVRVLWPSGILQGETVSPNQPTITVEELNRKPSSCPFLFTWNGTRFEFVTDFMGGGEMGDWEGPGRYDRPDPVEYVRIRGDQLVPEAGTYDIRITSELEEVLYVDRLQLAVVDHPSGIEVFPNEGLTDPPKAFALHAVSAPRVPAHVVDEHGHDVTSRVANVDRQYPDDFRLEAFRGFAASHTLTVDLPAEEGGQRRLTLLLTGWTDYAFSSDAVAANQAGLTLAPPSIDIQDATGRWRPAIADIGFPVGRPQTIAVDLGGYLRGGDRALRLTTNMRIYWDQILIGTTEASSSASMSVLQPLRATLTARGFSEVVLPDGREPETYNYDRVTQHSPWKAITGRYTREGDVGQLLARSDDQFVIARPGDEIALAFDAASATRVAAGWSRTFLLVADGFSKEMDINSGSPDRVLPLPFHGMSRYPYPPREHYPDDPEHRSYQEMYNTRSVVRPIPFFPE